MGKKNKLYTVNKWNRHLFVPEENMFELGGGTVDPYARGKNITAGTNYLVSAATKRRGLFEGAEDLKGGIGLGTVETAAKKELSKPIGGLRKPASAGGGMSTDIQAGLIAGGTALGGIAANAISDGYESSAGSTISNVGSTVGSALSTFNPVAGGLVNVGSQLFGGLTNRAIGTKVDKAKLAQANTDINRLNSFTSNAGSFDGIIGPEATASVDGTYKGGWFNKSGAEEKQKALEERITAARQFANRSIDNNIYNIADDQVNNMLANYAAFGGPLDMIGGSDMGAINYDLMSDYLTIKRQNAQNKNQMTNMFMGSPSTMFDFGGTLQTNGGDFGTGLVHIDAGLSHEMNPNDGVQMGVDQNGVPNLVEEGEVVFNDYVYSNRITLDDHTKELLHFPKKKEITYADAAKKLEKEIAERPNDPISEAGFKAQMEKLEEQQERQKQEMEAERAKAAFEALSPEEQTAVMQQVAAQEQAATQQQAMAEQQMQGVPVEQPAPEELTQQSTIQADSSPAALGQEAPVMAYGGKVNKFDDGGWKGTKPTLENAIKWAREYGFGPSDAQYVAKALIQVINKAPSKYSRQDVSMFGGDRALPYISYEDAYNSMIPTLTNTKEKWFNEWVKLGVPRNLAFGITHRMPVPGDTKGMKEREQAYNRLVRNYKKPVSTSRTAPTGTPKYSPIPFGNAAFTPSNSEPVYSLERPVETTTVPTPAAIQTPPVQGASVPKVVVQPEAPSSTPVVSTPRSTTPRSTATPSASVKNPPVNSVTGRPYDWYRNGSDGYSTPTGFTVGENGLIDKENGYTQEYRDLVGKLTADDIRKWAAEHPQDPSLLSFLARGNKLDDLTTEQWRKGALDGKYGFMHHVGNQILSTPSSDGTLSEEALTAAGRPAQVFHAMDGDNYDGYIEGALGPEVGEETRRETLPNGDVVIYHKRKDAASSTNATEPAATDTSKDLKPVHKSELPRYMGLMGPAVGLAMMSAGVGRPLTDLLDAAVASAGAVNTAGWKPLGNYLTYRPLDIWFEQNRLNANARATDRAILNSGANQGSKMAGLLAAGYNDQLASGNLFRQAQEYNDNLRKQVADFNRGTDQFNSEQYGATSRFNADAYNNARRANAQLKLQAAAQKMDADAGWYNSLYGNVAGLFKGISDIGTENKRDNMINWMISKGIFGAVDPNDSEMKKRVKVVNAEGGKLKKNKKRGLTF